MINKLKKKFKDWLELKRLERTKFESAQRIIANQLMVIETLQYSLNKANAIIKELEKKVAVNKISKVRKVTKPSEVEEGTFISDHNKFYTNRKLHSLLQQAKKTKKKSSK